METSTSQKSGLQVVAHIFALLVAGLIWLKIGGILGILIAAVSIGVIELGFLISFAGLSGALSNKADDVKAMDFARCGTDTAWLMAKRNLLVEADSKSLRDAISFFPRLDNGGALNLLGCIEYALVMTPKEYDDTRDKDDNWTVAITAVRGMATDKLSVQSALANLESMRRAYFSSLNIWRDHVPSIVPKYADPLEDSLNYEQAFNELPQASPVRDEVLKSIQKLLEIAQASLRKYENAWVNLLSACDTAIALTVQNQGKTNGK